MDVTPKHRTRDFHNFSLETPAFLDDSYPRLANDDTPQSRLRYRLRLTTYRFACNDWN